MFRRRRRQDEPPADFTEDTEIVDDDVEVVDEAAADEVAAPGRGQGPWDLSEIDDPGADGGRVDLGGMWLPGREGMELRLDIDEASQTVTSVTVHLDEGVLQVQPFAAPRTQGIWEGVRTEIAAGITSQGGTASIADGPFGLEVHAKIPVQLPDGSSAVQAARFFGVDGPRWFLRGVISGAAFGDQALADTLEGVFRDVVVVRGGDPMAPRDPLPLRLPQQAAEPGAPAAETHELNPFKRGPEITEVR